MPHSADNGRKWLAMVETTASNGPRERHRSGAKRTSWCCPCESGGDVISVRVMGVSCLAILEVFCPSLSGVTINCIPNTNIMVWTCARLCLNTRRRMPSKKLPSIYIKSAIQKVTCLFFLYSHPSADNQILQ